MLALAKTGPAAGQVDLLERPVPKPGPRQVLLEVAYAGICGSDVHAYHGRLRILPSAYPIWLGHEYAGVIAEVGSEVTSWQVGDRVTAEPSSGCGSCAECLRGNPNVCADRRFHGGGFARLVLVDEERLHRLPDQVGLRAAALLEPLACAVHAVLERTDHVSGRLCVIVGPGPLGVLTALVARAHSARVVLVGRSSSEKRLDLARRLGIEHTVEADKTDARSLVDDLSDGAGADIVFGCAGTGEAVDMALQLVGRRGQYTELALFGNRLEVDFEKVVTKEIVVRGAIGQRHESWLLALDLVRSGSLDVALLDSLITAELPLAEWRRGFGAAEGKRDLKVVLVP